MTPLRWGFAPAAGGLGTRGKNFSGRKRAA
nr:MAG TPA: hypothetical protein [Caudoviricetes sp.]